MATVKLAQGEVWVLNNQTQPGLADRWAIPLEEYLTKQWPAELERNLLKQENLRKVISYIAEQEAKLGGISDGLEATWVAMKKATTMKSLKNEASSKVGFLFSEKNFFAAQ